MNKKDITAVILSGGQGSRMGGVDKGWIEFEGQPLVARILTQLTLQVNEVIVSANRSIERYAALGIRVVEDSRPGHAGPLAGIEAALSACTSDWLLTCPVDTLSIPQDYAKRMMNLAPSVVLHQGRVQPVFMLVPRTALAPLQAFLDAGERKVGLWVERQGLSTVSFDGLSNAFSNLNDWQAMQQAQQ